MDDLISKLTKEGWNISQEFIQKNGYHSVNNAIHNLLNIDLKSAGISSLQNAATKEKSPQLIPPLVLQVANVRNVAAPKVNEESQFAPRMLKITLTDGKGFIQALEMDHISCLSLKTAPGTKIKIVSKVSSVSGYYLLKPSNISVLGGVVDDLYEKWKVSKEALKYSRGTPATDGTGPPPWVPFGKGTVASQEKCEPFKALADVASKPKDDKFQESREEVVSKLSQESSNKIFGGGQRMLDTNVQKILNAGFTLEQAQEALHRSKNNLERALRQLKRPFQSSEEDPDCYRPRGRGRRGGRRKRDVSGPDGSDDEGFMAPSSRPAPPASLSDFLNISVKAQSASKGTVYEQQLRELNRYSKESKNYENQDTYSYHDANYDYRKGATGHQNEFETYSNQSNSKEQSYQRKTYDHKGGGSRGIRGSNYGESHTGNHSYSQKDSGNYYGNKKPTGNYRGRNEPGNNQGGKYTRRDQNYHNYDDGDYQSGQHTGNYNNSIPPGNYRGSSYNKRGNTDNRRNTNNYDSSYNSGQSNNLYGAQQSKTSYGSRGNNYGQGRQSLGSNYNRPRQKQPHKYNNQNDTTAATDSKRTYTAEEQSLIGQFRQSMVISGDYQPDAAHAQNKNDDYNNERKSEPQSRSQYGRSQYYRGGSRGQNRGRGYRGSYQERY